MFIKWTKCMRGWPLVYHTYHQELDPPYKHADVVVFRMGRRGVVVGRWVHSWPDEDQAIASALGARQVPVWWWDEEDETPDDDGRELAFV